MLEQAVTASKSTAAPSPNGPDDLVGINEAARELKIAPSTISRQVNGGLIPNRGTAKRPKVSLAEARIARRDNLDPAQQRGDRATGSYTDERAQHEAIKRQQAALELAYVQGELVLRKEVEDLFATFGRMVRDGLLARWRLLAADMRGLSAGEIEAKGIASDEAVLVRVIAEVERLNASAADRGPSNPFSRTRTRRGLRAGASSASQA